MKKPYFPDALNDQGVWYGNFGDTFANFASALGFTGPEIIAILNDCKIAEWMIGSVLDPYEKLYSEVSGWVRTVLDAANGAPIPAFPMIPVWPALPPSATIVAGIDVRRVLWVERCKSSTNYTPDVIGVALRTEPTGTPFDPMTWQAKIRSIECTGPAQVRIKLAKASGEVDANAVYFRRHGQMVWTKLGVFTQAEITDTTPCAVPGQPEEREYLVRSVIKDVEIGIASDIETVIVRG